MYSECSFHAGPSLCFYEKFWVPKVNAYSSARWFGSLRNWPLLCFCWRNIFIFDNYVLNWLGNPPTCSRYDFFHAFPRLNAFLPPSFQVACAACAAVAGLTEHPCFPSEVLRSLGQMVSCLRPSTGVLLPSLKLTAPRQVPRNWAFLDHPKRKFIFQALEFFGANMWGFFPIIVP